MKLHTTTWLVRHIDSRLEATPTGATLDLEATAGALGLGAGRGRHSPLVRALHRCCQFGLARAGMEADLAVRRSLPPLTRHQIDRLPPGVRRAHDEWRAVERDASTLETQQRRARRIALALADLGEDVPTTEQRLHRYRIHPAVAHDAAVWAARLRLGRRDDAGGAGDLAVDIAPPAVTAAAARAAEGPPRGPAHDCGATPEPVAADLGGDAA